MKHIIKLSKIEYILTVLCSSLEAHVSITRHIFNTMNLKSKIKQIRTPKGETQLKNNTYFIQSSLSSYFRIKLYTFCLKREALLLDITWAGNLFHKWLAKPINELLWSNGTSKQSGCEREFLERTLDIKVKDSYKYLGFFVYSNLCVSTIVC